MKLNREQIAQIDKRQLSDREILLLELHTNLTLEEIGAALGISKQRASAVIKSAHKKIEAQNAKV